MTFKVKTPELKAVVTHMDLVMSSVKTGDLAIDKALAIVRAGSAVTSAVHADLKVRLAAPKLAIIEGAA